MQQAGGQGILGGVGLSLLVWMQRGALLRCCSLNRAPVVSRRYSEGQMDAPVSGFTLFRPR